MRVEKVEGNECVLKGHCGCLDVYTEGISMTGFGQSLSPRGVLEYEKPKAIRTGATIWLLFLEGIGEGPGRQTLGSESG